MPEVCGIESPSKFNAGGLRSTSIPYGGREVDVPLVTGRQNAPNTGANATKFFTLATKS